MLTTDIKCDIKDINLAEQGKRQIDWAFKEARRILTENREILDRCSKALLERETINADEFEKLIKGEELEPLPSISKPAIENNSSQPVVEGNTNSTTTTTTNY